MGKLSWFFAAAALIAISCGGKSDTEVGSTGVAQQAQEQAPVLDTFVASKDSWVSRAKPNQNHGADASIEVGGSHRRNGLAAFELSSVPINVTRATLVLSLREQGTASGNSQACQATFVAQTVGQDWTEGNGQTGPGVTWSCATDQNIGNNQRECENSWGGGTPLGPSRAGQPGQQAGTIEFDVTEDVRSGAAFGWRISAEGCDERNLGLTLFHSREGNLALAPRLILENPSFTVGPEGGTITAAGGKVILQIPPGALTESVPISITPTDQLPPLAGLVPGTLYEFGPSQLEFLIPAILTITYDPALVPSGIDPESLIILASAHGPDLLTILHPWEERPSSSDVATARVTGTIEHFSHNGVGVPVVRVEMSATEISILAGDTQDVTAVLFDEANNIVNHVVEWSSNNVNVASALPSSVLGQQVGVVTGIARGDAAATARVRNSAPDITALGNTLVHVQERPRRATFSGSVFVLDDDSDFPTEGDDETGNFQIAGACEVSENVPTNTTTLGGDFTCVDDEVMTDALVTCTLSTTDFQTVTVTITGRLFESSSCPTGELDGSNQTSATLAPGASQAVFLHVDNTDEGGDFVEYTLTVTNNPLP